MRSIITVFLITILISYSTESRAIVTVDSTTLNSSSITGNLVLNKTVQYLMKGFNYVQDGGSITIPAGTVIVGEFNTKGTLIIQRGRKIFANGTVDAPIIFTSQKPVGQRQTGDWGGVIILGRATINTATGATTAEIEGFGPGLGPIYGGNDDNDNSGVFRFVRLEFPGVNLTGISGNEINGLTMGGVGRGTVIEYVQVSYSGDDSFEWFGGTVNCNYLIAYKGLDDDFDTDNGFRGKIQFGLSVRDTGLVDISTSNSFESDNNVNTPNNFNGPRTTPIFSNMTVVGPFSQTNLSLSSLWGRGSHERRNSKECIYNSIVMGWRTGVRFDGTGVYNGCTGDSIQYRNNIFAGNVRLADTAASTSFSSQSWLQTPSFSNSVLSTSAAVQLSDPFGVYPNIPLPGNNVTNWMPVGGSPALSGADFSNPNLSGFVNVSFRGAFGTQNWTYQWAQFNPKNYLIPSTSNYYITVFPEGFYKTSTGQLNNPDSVRIYLRNTTAPFSVVDSSIAVIDKVTFTGKFVFKYAEDGTYYLQTKHRNSIETWSKSGGEAFAKGQDNYYDFTTAASQAYGSNQITPGGGEYGLFSGDDNQDGVVDLSDLVLTYNDVLAFTSGYFTTDNNNDEISDLSDLIIAYNNGSLFASIVRP